MGSPPILGWPYEKAVLPLPGPSQATGHNSPALVLWSTKTQSWCHRLYLFLGTLYFCYINQGSAYLKIHFNSPNLRRGSSGTSMILKEEEMISHWTQEGHSIHPHPSCLPMCGTSGWQRKTSSLPLESTAIVVMALRGNIPSWPFMVLLFLLYDLGTGTFFGCTADVRVQPALGWTSEWPTIYEGGGGRWRTKELSRQRQYTSWTPWA